MRFMASLLFLLHLQEQNAAIHRYDAQRRSSEYLSCGKTPTSAALAALAGQYEDARACHRINTHGRTRGALRGDLGEQVLDERDVLTMTSGQSGAALR